MNESNSQLESQFNSYFNEQNLRMDKDCLDEELIKEDEKMIELEDDLNNDLNNDLNMVDLKEINQPELKAANKPNDNHQLTTVDTSSLTNLVNKLSDNDIKMSEKAKQTELSSLIQNQQLQSSLNNLVQSNSQQQNNQFSQKLVELLLCSALGQQNGQNSQQASQQQQQQQPQSNGDYDPNKQIENKQQIKSSNEQTSAITYPSSFLNNTSSTSPMNRELNSQSRELNNCKDVNNLNKQATLAAALVASMNQFNNNQLSNSQLMNNQFNQNTNQIQNSLALDNVKSLLLNSQRKNEQDHNIFSGGFQNLLTNLNLSINSNQNDNLNQQQNTASTQNAIASPPNLWRPVRSTNAQNLITSAKQTGPASWIDRSKLGKAATQNLRRRHVSSRCDYTEYYKGYSSSAECGTKSCIELNYREHYHCLDCHQRMFVKKECLIRHFKWHRKREESLVNGFLRYSSCDDCAPEFLKCTFNRKHTHYHCLKKGCDKCYISTSDVQMHASYHRKDAMMLEEGFQRFRGTEDCECTKCQFSGQKTTHFHCMRSNCNYIFKNKAEMEKHKTAHFKDDQLGKDGFQKFQKNECGIMDCTSSSQPSHYHCIRLGCNAIFETTGQLYAHRKKHERREVELAYNKILFAQTNCQMFSSLGELSSFDTSVFEDTESFPGFLYTPEIDSLIQQLPLSTICSIPFENLVKECKGAVCLKYFTETYINDQTYFKCNKCDETCKLSNVEDHAKNHILIDESTAMMFELCEDGRNGLYECNLMDHTKHYHCRMYNCNFVISMNGSELKRLQHFKKHEDEQKDSFLDDVTYSSCSSINSTTDLNCSNSVGQSNSFADTNTEYLPISSPLESNFNGNNVDNNMLRDNYASNKPNNKKTLNDELNRSNQSSPNFIQKDDLERFASLINTQQNQLDSNAITQPLNNSYTSLNRSQDLEVLNNSLIRNSNYSNLNSSNGMQQHLQNSLLDGSNSLLLKRKRGRPPKKVEDDMICSKRNNLSPFLMNPLMNQDALNSTKRQDPNVSMFLNSILAQQQQNDLDNKNEQNNQANSANNYPGHSFNYANNYQSMNQANDSMMHSQNQKDSLSSFLNSSNSPSSNMNFQMLNYIANLNQTSQQQQVQQLINQIINPSLNSVIHQQQQLYKNLLKQHKKSNHSSSN